VCTAGVLDELAGYAPVRAVRGNNDGPDVAAWGAPDTLELDAGGLAVAMIHDAGPAPGRPARMRRRFPGAALVVFGHSHIPLDHTGEGQRIFNPGSPTDRRRQPQGTLGVLDVRDGQLVSARIVAVHPAAVTDRSARDAGLLADQVSGGRGERRDGPGRRPGRRPGTARRSPPSSRRDPAGHRSSPGHPRRAAGRTDPARTR